LLVELVTSFETYFDVTPFRRSSKQIDFGRTVCLNIFKNREISLLLENGGLQVLKIMWLGNERVWLKIDRFWVEG